MDDLLQEMIDPTPEPGDRPRRRRLVATIAIVALAVVGITSLTTGALFTDRERTDDGFKTGTVDLTVGQLKFTQPIAGNLVPGSAASSAIDVKNAGSLSLRFAVEYTATHTPAGADIDDGTAIDGDAGTPSATGGDVRKVLQLSVFEVASAADCTTTVPATTLYGPKPLGDGTAATDGPQQLLGNKQTGNQNGDITLGAGDDKELCFVVRMDDTAGNEYQDAAANLTLDFYAEQTANN